MKQIKRLLDKTIVDDKIINISKAIKREYKKTLVTSISAGLSFLIALYIRDVLKSIVELVLLKSNITNFTGIFYEIVIALVVVAICVITIIILSRWQVSKDE